MKDLAFLWHGLKYCIYEIESDIVHISKYEEQRELAFFIYLLKFPCGRSCSCIGADPRIFISKESQKKQFGSIL